MIGMVRVPRLSAILPVLCLAVALPANQALAQQRLVFKVAAENTQYTRQHTIDVGDVAGHQVRLFEIHRTYPSNAPMIDGMRIVKSWTRGVSDYTNNNGEATSYGVYVLENGDKFFTRGSPLFRCRTPRQAISRQQRLDPSWAGREGSPRLMEWRGHRPKQVPKQV